MKGIFRGVLALLYFVILYFLIILANGAIQHAFQRGSQEGVVITFWGALIVLFLSPFLSAQQFRDLKNKGAIYFLNKLWLISGSIVLLSLFFFKSEGDEWLRDSVKTYYLLGCFAVFFIAKMTAKMALAQAGNK